MEKNDLLERILEGSMEPTSLPFETLRRITDDFSAERIVGEGGFGTVYKGVVGNKNVAVKKIRSIKTINDKLFRREVNTLLEVNHENVVRFLGLCAHTVETPIKIPESRGYIYAETRERLLCFDYINNGSLDRIITDELRGLEWDKRYAIIKGICAGLNYLHMEKCIIHMDLKPGNILLDDHMVPKITDFGLSRPIENSQTTSTDHFVSQWYTAPENIHGGRMTVMSDMYSLGVIIIEVVTGEKGIPDSKNNILRRWWHRWIRSAKSAEEVPPEYHQQLTKCIEIGMLCLKIDPFSRPSISKIMSKFVEMDSTNNHSEYSIGSNIGQINPPAAYWQDDMLRVEPLDLQFANSRHNKNGQQILSCSVELCNGTDGFIAFKIQRTSPLPYSIEPNMDIVKPRSKCSVEITLPQAHKAALRHSFNNKKYKKEFIVRSIKVNEDIIIKDIEERMLNAHTSDHNIDEIHLRVVSEEPCDKETLVSSPEKKIYYTEKTYDETNKISEERLIKALEAQSKIDDLNMAMLRLQEKISNMESYEKIQRHALLSLPSGSMSENLSIPIAPKNLENGFHEAEEPKEPQSAPPVIKYYGNVDQKLRKSTAENQLENVDALIDCVVKNLGYCEGKPVAALTIYKCLLHWKSFEAEKTSVFDRLFQLIGSAIENEDNDNLAYWLSNTSSLLYLMQRSLKAAGAQRRAPRKKPPQPTSLLGRMSQGLPSASLANMQVQETDVVHQVVEAKYPALLFKQQVTAYVEKIYGIIRDNMKRELSSLISLCIQAPRTMKDSMLRIPGRSSSQPQSNHWQKIIEKLDVILKVLQDNHVPLVLAQKNFTQIFSYINVQLFNSLLLHRECCSSSNGEYVKAGLAELELWCAKATAEYAAASLDEIRHIRQAVGFLVIFQKFKISCDEIVHDLCPILSIQQLYRICTQYRDDKYNTQSDSSDVLSNMRVLMTEDSNNADISSFLLDDNSSIPFSVEDITNAIQEKDFSDVKPAEELLENPAFQFLQDY